MYIYVTSHVGYCIILFSNETSLADHLIGIESWKWSMAYFNNFLIFKVSWKVLLQTLCIQIKLKKRAGFSFVWSTLC